MPSNAEFQDEDDDPIVQEAADWAARRDRGLNPQEVELLTEWLESDPRHAREYDRVRGSWQKLDQIGAVPELTNLADSIERRARSRQKRQRTWGLVGAFAAAIAIVAGVIFWQVPFGGGESAPLPTKSFVVLPSTARNQVLLDGSIAKLNGDSRIETEFTQSERRIRLVRGEAHFEVAKNPNRPFIVSAGPVSVVATGTAFNVRMASSFVEVLVTEGAVKLEDSTVVAQSRTTRTTTAAQPLGKGERAVIDSVDGKSGPTTVDRPSQKEIEHALAWEGTQLVFDRTPLDQVAEAFNTHNTRKLILATPVLRNRTLSGTFRADNLDGFIELLSASVDVTAVPQEGNRILLRANR